MTPTLILQNISKHIQLSQEESNHFVSLIKGKTLQKKSLLLSEGQTCKYLNFVHSGALRAYIKGKGSKETTVMFAVTDWWITDMYCFLNNQPAMVYIEAIEDSSIFQLSKDNLDKLYRTIPKFERFFRILMQNAYTREQLRVIDSLSLSAESRYDIFLAKYPHIVKVVTQKQIASYLGITPEFLSLIRKNKSKGLGSKKGIS